jgi:hypothetical protein
MFEGLDKEEAPLPGERASATPQAGAEAAPAAEGPAGEKKPGKLALIFARLRSALPKRKPKAPAPEAAAPAEADASSGIGMPKPKKKLPKAALPLAAGLLLTLGAGAYYYLKIMPHAPTGTKIASTPAVTAKPDETNKAVGPAEGEKAEPPKTGTAATAEPAAPPKEETKPPVQTATAETAIPAPLPPAQPAPAPAQTAKAETAAVLPETRTMNVGIMVPVDFNTQVVKVLTADVELLFVNEQERKNAEKKQFLYEVAIEQEIEAFFKDRFYEDTHYAQDKLMAALFEKFKKRGDMEKLAGVNLLNFSLK